MIQEKMSKMSMFGSVVFSIISLIGAILLFTPARGFGIILLIVGNVLDIWDKVRFWSTRHKSKTFNNQP
jgi:hypothetical protein